MKKKILVLLSLLLAFSLLIGCSQQDNAENGNDSGDDVVTIGVAMIDLTNPFYVNMMEAGDDAAEDFGAKVIWKSSEGTLDNQIGLVENFIEQGVDAILIDPIDTVGIIPVINQAGEAGIPVVTMGNFVDSEYNISTLYNDYNDTFRIGEIIAKQLGEEGEVALIFGNSGNFVSDQRQKGFEDAIAKYPNMSLVSQPSNWDAAQGMTVAADIMNANPNLEAIHVVSDGVTFGVLQAIQQAGKQDSIFITSYDGEKEASQMVEDGEIALTLLTGSKRVGYWNVKTGTLLAKGEKFDTKEYLSSHFVMTDEFKKQVEDWGLAEDISIIDPQTAIKYFDDYRADLGPK